MASDGDYEWLSDYLVSVFQSPTWAAPIAQFVDERCDIFDDSEENKLEYTIRHNEFRALIADLLTSHLLEVSITPEQFDRFCDQGLSANTQLHQTLVQHFLSVDDFLSFKAMMQKHNADLDRQVLNVEDTESCVDPGSPTSISATHLANSIVQQSIQSMESETALHNWQMYEDDLQKAMQASKDDQENREAQLRSEEAQLSQAIALSLQLEEERLRMIASSDETMISARSGVAEMGGVATVLPPPAPPRNAGFTSAPLMRCIPPKLPTILPSSIPNLMCVEPISRPPPQKVGFTSAPLCYLLPAQQASLAQQPIEAPPMPTPIAEDNSGIAAQLLAEHEQMRMNLGSWRERAQQAMVTPRRPANTTPEAQPMQQAPQHHAVGLVPAEAMAAATAATATQGLAGPSADERRQRAEHLRRQRDLLLQKRKRDRNCQLEAFQRARGNVAAAAVDQSLYSDAAMAGRRRVAELTPGAVVASAVDPPIQDAAARAELMRQALTLQLRQTLVRTTPSDASMLGEQLNQLELMKQR